MKKVNRPRFPGPSGTLPETDSRLLSVKISDGKIKKVESNAEEPNDLFFQLREEILAETRALKDNINKSNQRPDSTTTIDRYYEELSSAIPEVRQVNIGVAGNSMRAFYSHYQADIDNISTSQLATISSILTKHEVLEETMPVWKSLRLEMEATSYSNQENELVNSSIEELADILKESSDLVDLELTSEVEELFSKRLSNDEIKYSVTSFQLKIYNNIIISLLNEVRENKEKASWIGSMLLSAIISGNFFDRLTKSFSSIFGWIKNAQQTITSIIQKYII